MFCGTLAVHGGIEGGELFEMELEDPVLGRRLTHVCRVSNWRWRGKPRLSPSLRAKRSNPGANASTYRICSGLLRGFASSQ
jgi:hypothetical protein